MQSDTGPPPARAVPTPPPSLRDTIKGAVDKHTDTQDDAPVGLAQNAEGVPFQCGTCQYFDQGICHNEHPKLNGTEVASDWCCNHYDHEGMQHVID